MIETEIYGILLLFTVINTINRPQELRNSVENRVISSVNSGR